MLRKEEQIQQKKMICKCRTTYKCNEFGCFQLLIKCFIVYYVIRVYFHCGTNYKALITVLLECIIMRS